MEFDKLDLSDETIAVYDGLYEIVVNMDDSGIWVNRQPTSGEFTQKYKISDTFETGYYRITVAEGMAQIFRNNKILGTWRSPLSAHSPMILRSMSEPSTTTFVAIKGIDDVYYHSEDFEGNIERGFTAEDYWFDETDALIEDEAAEASYKHEVVTEDGNSFVKMTGEGTYFLNAISYDTSFKWRGKFEGSDGGFSVRFREAMKCDFSEIGYNAETNQWFARNSDKLKETVDGESRYVSSFTDLGAMGGTLDSDWHNFELVLKGGKGTLLCDGAEVISAEGFRNSYGKVGFEVRGTNSELSFDNVEYSGEGKATAGMSYLTGGRADFYRNFKGQIISASAAAGMSWYYSEDNGVTWAEAKPEEPGQWLNSRATNNLNLLSGNFLRIRYSGNYTYAYFYDENTNADNSTIVSGTEMISSVSAGARVEPAGSMDNVPFSEVPSRLMQIKSGPYKGRVIYCRGGGGEIYGTVYMYWSDDYDGINDPSPTKAVWHPAEIQLSYFDTGVNIQESIAVDMPDGTLRYYVRTDTGHMGYFTSSDGGETWDRPLEITMEDLISPLACYSIQRKGDTSTYYAFWEYDLVTANLTYLESPRNRRALAVSYDGMETWEYVGDIEEERRTASCTSASCNYGARYLDGAVYMSYYMGNIHDKMFRIDETKIKTLKRFTAPHYRTQDYSTVRDFYDRNSVIGKTGGVAYIYGGYIYTDVNGNGLVTAEVVAKAVGAEYMKSGNIATLTIGETVVTFTNGKKGYDINGTVVTTESVCYEDGFLNVPVVAEIFGKYVSENDCSYTICNEVYVPYVLKEVEGAGIHRDADEMMESIVISELNEASGAGDGKSLCSILDIYEDLIGFVPDVSEVRNIAEVYNRMTGVEYTCFDDIKNEFNRALDEQKKAETKTYSFDYGTTHLNIEFPSLPDASKYSTAEGGIINTNLQYAVAMPAAIEGKPCTYAVTFDARNSIQGLPLLLHIGGNSAKAGLVICPTDTIGTEWNSYKLILTETAGHDYLGVVAYVKPYGSNESYVHVPVVTKYEYKSGDNFWTYGSRSGAKQTIRPMYDTDVAAAIYPGSDPDATVWELKNLQVTGTVVASGNITVTDNKISVNGDFKAVTDKAMVMLAVYDGENRMCDSDLMNNTMGEGSFNLSADYSEGNKVLLFIWDAEMNMVPMIQPIDLIAAEENR